MPITLEILRENRVVLQIYSDPLNAVQMNELKEKMHFGILASATKPVHIIADFRQVSNLPGAMLTSGMFMLRSAHPNTGAIVFVTTSSFVNAMAHAFKRLVPKFQVRVVQSFEAALVEIDAILAKETGSAPK